MPTTKGPDHHGCFRIQITLKHKGFAVCLPDRCNSSHACVDGAQQHPQWIRTFGAERCSDQEYDSRNQAHRKAGAPDWHVAFVPVNLLRLDIESFTLVFENYSSSMCYWRTCIRAWLVHYQSW